MPAEEMLSTVSNHTLLLEEQSEQLIFIR